MYGSKKLGGVPPRMNIPDILLVANLKEMREYPNTLDNSYKMNGSNIMNNDLTSTLTLGIVFEFTPQKKPCVLCGDN